MFIGDKKELFWSILGKPYNFCALDSGQTCLF